MSGAPSDPQPTGRRPLVIIIDPNEDVRTILDALLTHKGLQVASTADPDEALNWARTRRPDVLIGEHPLLLGDGRLLCAVLLEDSRTAAIPFVAVTARAFPDDLQTARATHHHGVFAKPVEPHRILDHVEALVQHSRRPPPPPPEGEVSR